MINSHQLLATFAHGALSSKQIFGRRFVSHQRIGRNISQRVNRLGIRRIAADQAAAFTRGFAPRMIKDFVGVRLLERNGHGALGKLVALPLDVRKGSAFP